MVDDGVVEGDDADPIALAMGEEGVSSRILAVKYGAFLTYASRSASMESYILAARESVRAEKAILA